MAPPLTYTLGSSSRPKTPAPGKSTSKSHSGSRTKGSATSEDMIDDDIRRLEELAEQQEQNLQNEDDEGNKDEEDIFTAPRKVNLPTADEKPSRKRLVEILENPYLYKVRKNASRQDPELTPEQITTAYRQLDRYSRWLSFVWMTSNFYYSIIVDVYKQYGRLDPDGDLYITARDKIKSSIKGFKSKTLTRIIVRISLLLFGLVFGLVFGIVSYLFFSSCRLLRDFPILLFGFPTY
jgi:hypothetical protein